MTRPESRQVPYHHGNLRSVLIAAGMEIVETEGVHQLSLRGVARKARVTHSAPYHHFANKAELLAAVAAAGFDRLLESMRRDLFATDILNPVDRLRAIGGGYMRFAAANPSLFRLMFRPELTHPSEYPVLRDAESRAVAALLEALAAGQKSGEFPGSDPAILAAFAWSCVHGLSMLHIDHVLQQTPLGSVPFPALVTAVNEMILLGLQSQELKAVFKGATADRQTAGKKKGRPKTSRSVGRLSQSFRKATGRDD